MQRLNRILLIGGGGLAIGAVLLALLTKPFSPTMLGINLAAIGLGLLMGKGIGMFMFRRVLPGASPHASGALVPGERLRRSPNNK